jgi:hypothetical protein
MELTHKLERVARNHLFGQTAPAELRLLWQLSTARQFASEKQLLATLVQRLTLLDLNDMEEHPVFFERYSRHAMLERCAAEGRSPAPFEPRVGAYDDVVENIAFFAIDHQQRFWGYWLGREREIPVAEAPVALLDSAGNFSIAGRSVIEVIMSDLLDDMPEAAVLLRRHAAEQLGADWVNLAKRMRQTNLTELTAIHGDPDGLFKERVLARTGQLMAIAG